MNQRNVVSDQQHRFRSRGAAPKPVAVISFGCLEILAGGRASGLALQGQGAGRLSLPGELLSAGHRENFVTASLLLGPSWKNKTPASLMNRGKQGFRYVAVTVGFEPTLALTPNNISSVAPSAARTRHQPE